MLMALWGGVPQETAARFFWMDQAIEIALECGNWLGGFRSSGVLRGV